MQGVSLQDLYEKGQRDPPAVGPTAIRTETVTTTGHGSDPIGHPIGGEQPVKAAAAVPPAAASQSDTPVADSLHRVFTQLGMRSPVTGGGYSSGALPRRSVLLSGDDGIMHGLRRADSAVVPKLSYAPVGSGALPTRPLSNAGLVSSPLGRLPQRGSGPTVDPTRNTSRSIPGGFGAVPLQADFDEESVDSNEIVGPTGGMRFPSASGIHQASGINDDTYPDGSDDEEFEEDEEVPMPPFPDEDRPVVPPEHVQRIVRPITWSMHPSATIVLSLLHRRGVQWPQHKDIIEYHMAEKFLDCLGYLRHGAYFVKYAQKHAPPKERFLIVQVQDDQLMRPTPYLCWYVHQHGVQIIDKVPLDALVDVTTGHGHSHAFRRHLVSHDVIKGCYTANHKARFPTSGCFTLWFYDRVSRQPRSVDLLTTNHQIFDVWVTTMRGILSVNSVSLNRRIDADTRLEHYAGKAQTALAQGSDGVVNSMEGWLDK